MRVYKYTDTHCNLFDVLLRKFVVFPYFLLQENTIVNNIYFSLEKVYIEKQREKNSINRMAGFKRMAFII